VVDGKFMTGRHYRTNGQVVRDTVSRKQGALGLTSCSFHRTYDCALILENMVGYDVNDTASRFRLLNKFRSLPLTNRLHLPSSRRSQPHRGKLHPIRVATVRYL
jgi:hypothetical protein